MLKKTSRIAVRLAVGTMVFLGISCAVLIFNEHDTLFSLVHPGVRPSTTAVFSRWLEIPADHPPSKERLLAWLSALNYRSVKTPYNAGDYSIDGQRLTVFVRPFRYPDKDYPAQLLDLEFSGSRLAELIAVSGHASLTSWRLEPKALAVWGAMGKASHPQVRVSDLPPYVPRAILSMEDKRFFQHGAFDIVGILRASWIDLRAGRLRQGASTISQQLARSIFLDVRRTWKRKVLEAALALYLELRYSKPQLLEMYLNQVYWGQEGSESVLGIESVSQTLFGKPAHQLTVAESAMLAGMLQSPNRYSPHTSPRLAEEREKMVLKLMSDQNVITPAQYRKAQAEKIHIVPIKKSNEAAYFLAALRDDLSERYTLPVLLNQGWSIFTTLDPLLQHAAVNVFASPQPSPLGRGRRSSSEAPQEALVAIDPSSGAVLAWVGGTNYKTNPFDHAVSAKRQPGSAFKPFVALAALETRKVTTATMLDDRPVTLKGQNGSWTPQNYDRRYRGKVSVWDSVVYSLNIPMVRLAMQTGLAAIIDTAHRCGIESPLRDDLSLALGTSEVSLLELTGAYSTIANHGERHAPYTIEYIMGPDATIIETHQPGPEKMFAPALADLVTQMLEAVLDVGTGKGARSLGFTDPAAGKTGTSENYQDAWFIGYTTKLVCGVWVGYDKPESLGHSAAGIALPLWTAFMKKADSLDPVQAFTTPEEFIWKSIDPQSGLLAQSGCPQRRTAAFLLGTEPTQSCPLHPGGLIGFFKRFTSKAIGQK